MDRFTIDIKFKPANDDVSFSEGESIAKTTIEVPFMSDLRRATVAVKVVEQVGKIIAAAVREPELDEMKQIAKTLAEIRQEATGQKADHPEYRVTDKGRDVLAGVTSAGIDDHTADDLEGGDTETKHLREQERSRA